MGYSCAVIRVEQTSQFGDWFAGLAEERAKAKIVARIRRLSLGNAGDARPVGGGKRGQDKDIAAATELSKSL